MLLKVSSYNAVGIGVRMVAGLVSSKLVAFYLGAPGMALLGELRNFLSSVHSLSVLGIQNGVIKYVSEFKENRPELKKVLSTAGLMVLTVTVLLSCTIYFGAGYWNRVVFGESQQYLFAIRLIGLMTPFYSMFMFGSHCINGFAKYKLHINIGIATNVVSLLATIILIINLRVDGAMMALILGGVFNLLFILIVFFAKRTKITQWVSLKSFDVGYVKKFLSYTGMTFFSAIATPWIYIGIRQRIIDVEGLQNAGLWDGMVRISDYYMMFATTLMTLYVLPKLSEIKTDARFKQEIFNFYRTILPIFVAGAVFIFVIKGFIIRMIFTQEFLAMKPLFFWQLLGDVFRLASVVIAYQFVAKNMFWYFVVTNVISLATIYLTSSFFIGKYGFVGASMGHFISYMTYFFVLLSIFRKPLLGMR